MSESAGQLNLVQLVLDGPQLFREGFAGRLPMRDADIGYLVHMILTGLFGPDAPRPFSIKTIKDSHVTILGYCQKGMAELEFLAKTYATPQLFRLCDWGQCASKPMPEQWPESGTFGFEVRVCPVRRAGRGSAVVAVGAEVDAFLMECWSVGSTDVPVSREAVYVKWLAEQFESIGGAKLLQASLVAFKRERVTRRTQGSQRKSVTSERPDALLRGTLQVSDSELFSRLLARGVGRHRSFGFGMLTLSRAGAPC